MKMNICLKFWRNEAMYYNKRDMRLILTTRPTKYCPTNRDICRRWYFCCKNAKCQCRFVLEDKMIFRTLCLLKSIIYYLHVVAFVTLIYHIRLNLCLHRREEKSSLVVINFLWVYRRSISFPVRYNQGNTSC